MKKESTGNKQFKGIIDAFKTAIKETGFSLKVVIGAIIAVYMLGCFLLACVIHYSKGTDIFDNTTSLVVDEESYTLELDDNYTFSCDGFIDEATSDFTCSDHEISGEYAGDITITSDSGELSFGSDIFTQPIKNFSISADQYKTENYSREDIVASFANTSYITFLISHNGVEEEEKKVSYSVRLSEDDLKMLDTAHEKWKTEKEEAEAKAKAEAEAKAKAKAEAEARAKTNSSSASSGRSSGSSSNSSKPFNNSSSSSGSSGSSGYSSNTQNVVSGYCKDGTAVTGVPSARGKANECYGHGGWQDQY